ncbi:MULTISPECIES: homoserine dehydrogenase [Glycomyces]|uniref:Homoserine dehydrogenase n=1 Tax=Glycomyces niveus TaxID=2820287 RepID=A0ABS3U180_9ACTN|nr:homoserine dehydrogenase [Glycomyces sp. NEAU-S30]MBO3732529.1 homoserine dehydrogenase [Glycomyces sp. NEAU-S30]
MKLALLGCGNVGSEVVRLMRTRGEELASRVGEPVEIVGIAVRRLDRDRSHLPVEKDLFTTDALGLVKRPDVDIVVEVAGGIEPARTWITTALAEGKSVVTANKALLAEDGPALSAAAKAGGADLYYEAAAAAAIPLMRPLRESLHGDTINRVLGIVNGTTNYILSQMTQTGAAFEEALGEATELGYAEADPTADVDNYDAAAKAALIASLAFHTHIDLGDVYREGIRDVSAADIASAAAQGRVVKPLCIATREADGVSVRVHPAMIPATHPLANVNGAYNAVFVEAESAGRLMFYGAGAGGTETASAVLGDIVAVARNKRGGMTAFPPEAAYQDLPVKPIGEARTRYHVSLDVVDEPGVLARVAATFAHHGVSLATVHQSGQGDEARLVVVTHTAADKQLSDTVEELSQLTSVHQVASVMRVEGE